MSIGERLGWLCVGLYVGAWITNYLNYKQFAEITDAWATNTADDAERWLRNTGD